jgi:hypothetical protein
MGDKSPKAKDKKQKQGASDKKQKQAAADAKAKPAQPAAKKGKLARGEFRPDVLTRFAGAGGPLASTSFFLASLPDASVSGSPGCGWGHTSPARTRRGIRNPAR